MPAKGRVPVEDLLEHLGARAGIQLARPDALDEPEGRRAVRVVAPGDIHGDVRVDEDHHPRPASISARIWSMSPVGAPRLERRATGSAGARSSAIARSMARRTHAPFETPPRRAALRRRASRLSEIRTCNLILICSYYYECLGRRKACLVPV